MSYTFSLLSVIFVFIAVFLFLIYGIPLIFIIHYVLQRSRMRRRRYNGSYSSQIYSKHLNAQSMEYIAEKDTYQQGKCMVCLEQFQYHEGIVNLRCNHLFHNLCIKKWIAVKNNCPVCSEPCD
eukprot:NODE_365_length_10088_cov_0.583041.p2 type:complete len:123 gc:universal NODE_365_length_10088_cov_0.583041:574-206(-)